MAPVPAAVLLCCVALLTGPRLSVADEVCPGGECPEEAVLLQVGDRGNKDGADMSVDDEGSSTAAEMAAQASESSAKVATVLENVLKSATDTYHNFAEYAERISTDTKQLSTHFAQEHATLEQLQGSTEKLSATAKEEKERMTEKMEEFKRATLKRLTDLQSTDEHLEADNAKLTQSNQDLASNVAKETAAKEALMKKMAEMIGNFKQQSKKQEDMVMQHHKDVSDQVSSDMQAVLENIKTIDKKEDHLGKHANATAKQDRASLLESSKVETTTLVLR